ncbi:MAG TPA: electron transfer flavoprotein subunit alpha/FixB family protein, partial [Burkholderiales bacterium]|nr:electron transfer flavoprotein subunit alpha/FixB family protein [Burkholderiales bacterium]
MAVLVIAEHDGKSLKPGTANAVTAAGRMGGEVTALVAGRECADAAQAAARLEGVKKVLLCEAPQYEGFLAENLAKLIVPLAA